MAQELQPPLLEKAVPDNQKESSLDNLTQISHGKESQPRQQQPQAQRLADTKPKLEPVSSTDQHPDVKKDITILPTNTKGLHTVFIHKLYNMPEDNELKHLIWWAPSNVSFLITPGEEFSKASAQYFKYTNVAFFIR